MGFTDAKILIDSTAKGSRIICSSIAQINQFRHGRTVIRLGMYPALYWIKGNLIAKDNGFEITDNGSVMEQGCSATIDEKMVSSVASVQETLRSLARPSSQYRQQLKLCHQSCMREHTDGGRSRGLTA